MFQDRIQAGQLLVPRVKEKLDSITLEKMVILSIPRGGVVVGSVLAQALGCSHDIVITKKLPAPGQNELAFGAVGLSEGSLYLNDRLIVDLGITEEYLKQMITQQQIEIKRREAVYRGGNQKVELKEKTVLIVDDGIATGATMIAALREAWTHSPHRLYAVTPVIAKSILPKIETEADGVIFLETPDDFFAVGQYYQDFGQVSDEEVIQLLKHKNTET